MMLVTSKIDKSNWLWVNVPKTASTATMKTFFPERRFNEQTHHTYKELISMYGELNAFATVRNPITRFRSGLNHLFSVCECGKCTFALQTLPSTIDVILFLHDMLLLQKKYDNFFEIAYKNGENLIHLEIVKSIQHRFSQYIQIGTPYCVRWPFVMSQSFLLDGPQQKLYIFKYENYDNYASFIKNSLGYTLDNTIYRKYPNNLGVDFEDATLLSLIRTLYASDFQKYTY